MSFDEIAQQRWLVTILRYVFNNKIVSFRTYGTIICYYLTRHVIFWLQDFLRKAIQKGITLTFFHHNLDCTEVATVYVSLLTFVNRIGIFGNPSAEWIKNWKRMCLKRSLLLLHHFSPKPWEIYSTTDCYCCLEKNRVLYFIIQGEKNNSVGTDKYEMERYTPADM